MDKSGKKIIISKNANNLSVINKQISIYTKFVDKSSARIVTELLAKANEHCWKLKDYKKATEYFEKCLNINPDFIDALSGFAQHQRLNVKNYNYAIELYSKVITINPKYENAYLRRGFCKENLKDFIGYLADFNEDMKLKEIKSETYVSRALIKSRLKDFIGVIDDYTKAIELNKSNDFAFTNRGIEKFHLKKYEEAISDFKTSIEIIIERNKTSNKIENYGVANLNCYGEAKFELGEYRTALKLFFKSIEQHPSHHFTYERIAKVYEKLNDSENYQLNIEKFNLLNEIRLKNLESELLRNQQNEKRNIF